MSGPEYRNMPAAQDPNPESPLDSTNIPQCCHISSVDRPAAPEAQHEESFMAIMERFIEQDQELGQNVELLEHLRHVEDPPVRHSPKLILAEKLAQILDDARDKGIPYSLLEYLWELRDCHPEEVKEPPIVREHALSDVIGPMWEHGLEHELKTDLLFDLEGEENMEKLYVPQPQSEIDDPQNLYQLVRKAWDQNRMEELLAMIEENDYALIGETMEEGAARYRAEITELAKGFKERMAKKREETA